MKKTLLTVLAFVCLAQLSFAQKKDTTVLTGEAAKQLMRQIKMDTTKFLKNATDGACKCVDSIKLRGKGSKEVSADISKCIDDATSSYQVAIKVYHSMIDAGNNNKIIMGDKTTNEYKTYYYEIERWLNDSCSSLRKAIAADNKESENSFSDDKVALGYYNKGVVAMNKDNMKEALPWFEKAVAQDEKFAFAWDNVGICRRKLGDLDGALAAYTKSLEIDPKGKTPLQNIPVVYEFKKDYDKALAAYQNISKVYPDDAEAYYGIGRMYSIKNDLENALDNMCKAYNAYIAISSPYRSDAEANISALYKKMKDLGKEEKFFAILKDNNISTK